LPDASNKELVGVKSSRDGAEKEAIVAWGKKTIPQVIDGAVADDDIFTVYTPVPSALDRSTVEIIMFPDASLLMAR
jgi:hypothetical protein